MPTITHSHNLSLTIAKAQLQLLAKDLEKKYAPQVTSYESTWYDDKTLNFKINYKRATVSGKITVTSSSAIIEYSLPFLFRAMNKLIAKKITDRFNVYFKDKYNQAA